MPHRKDFRGRTKARVFSSNLTRVWASHGLFTAAGERGKPLLNFSRAAQNVSPVRPPTPSQKTGEAQRDRLASAPSAPGIEGRRFAVRQWGTATFSEPLLSPSFSSNSVGRGGVLAPRPGKIRRLFHQPTFQKTCRVCRFPSSGLSAGRGQGGGMNNGIRRSKIFAQCARLLLKRPGLPRAHERGRKLKSKPALHPKPLWAIVLARGRPRPAI